MAIGGGGRAPWRWRAGRRGLRRVAAGIFYGVADAAIKAVAVGWHAHGIARSGLGLDSGGGGRPHSPAFSPSRPRCGSGSAITAISLMNALAALVALACGLLAFAESLGANAVAVVAHLVAIARRARLRAGAGRRPGRDGADRRSAAGRPLTTPAAAPVAVLSRRGRAQPAANASASSHGPGPGRRLNRTSLKRRLRASA